MALAGTCRTTQVLRFFKFPRYSFNFLTETEPKSVNKLLLINNVHCKYFTTDKKPEDSGKPGDPKTAEQAKKKKGLKSPLITLILSENDVHGMTLEQAEKLSKRRNLKLVKIVDFDTKTERPVYKLMTALEFFQEGSKMKEKKKKERESSFKETKLFTLSSKIADHDLDSKIRLMFKLLKKKHEVRVLISHDGNPSRAEEIGKMVEDELVEVSSSKERTAKSNTLKLSIKPKLETDADATESEADLTSDKKIDKLDVNENEAKAATSENK